jgi:hypothetical protein
LAQGIMRGVTAGEIEASLTPNQGILRSWKRALLVGLGAAILVTILFSTAIAITSDESVALTHALSIAVVAVVVPGVAAWLLSGGYACLSHCALRLVLWRMRALPLDTVNFLEYASERTFLYRVGGGYEFFHGLLQDYFASLKSQ